MLKAEAIELLGGSPTAAAAAIGITPQAVSQWPDELPDRIADRVQAALIRLKTTAEQAPAAGAAPGYTCPDQPKKAGKPAEHGTANGKPKKQRRDTPADTGERRRKTDKPQARA